jgi:AcrR family transcriptional regulator
MNGVPMAPVKERREREKQKLRQEILDAARDLFVRDGYENVSMRRIADKIEYSPTTIYLYFQDKAEILYCLCEETFARLVREFERLKENYSGDPVQCLRRGMRAYIEFGLKYPNHYKVTFISHPQHHEPDRYLNPNSMGMKAFGFLPRLVGEAVQQGKFRPVDVEATSQVIWAAIHGLTSLLIAHPDFPWVQKSALMDHMLDTVLDGLKA